jgi:hypothetical protein
VEEEQYLFDLGRRLTMYGISANLFDIYTKPVVAELLKFPFFLIVPPHRLSRNRRHYTSIFQTTTGAS